MTSLYDISEMLKQARSDAKLSQEALAKGDMSVSVLIRKKTLPSIPFLWILLAHSIPVITWSIVSAVPFKNYEPSLHSIAINSKPENSSAMN